MSRKYIKNCTGDECEGKVFSEKRSAHSAFVSRLIFYFLLLAFVGVSVYVLFFAQYLQIVQVQISGTQELSTQDLLNKVDESLDGKLFGIIPKNNFMFISQNNISNMLAGNFKKIRTVTITKKFPGSLLINIDERKALLVWCRGDDDCFLIDEGGVAYTQADFSSPELAQNNLLTIRDTSGDNVAIGEKIIEPSYEQYALAVKDTIAKVGFEASGQYSTPSRMAEEIDVATNQGTDLYFSTQSPLEDSVKTLDTVMKKEIIPQGKKDDIAYIDLRTENKVFYKLKSYVPPADQAGDSSQSSKTDNAENKKEDKK